MISTGYCSWRSKDEGSWFIQDLIEVFQQNHQELNVLSMLTLVNGKCALKRESRHYDPNKNMKCQIPCIVSQLTKHFYLRSK